MKTFKLLTTLENYLKMIKFSHSIFALPFAGIAVIEVFYWEYFKNHTLDLLTTKEILIKILGILICMVSLRSAAMGFNRIVDRKFDKENPRTKDREIPSNKISLKNAILFVIIFLVLFVTSAFIINPLAGFLSPIAIFLTFGYSYTKRFTYLCHFVLGFAIGIAPIATWIALTNKISLESIGLGLVLLFYIAGFDILYSLMDIDFDKKNKLFSLPSRFGISISLWIARISHTISFSLMVWLGIAYELNQIYFFSIGIIFILYTTEHYLVHKNLKNIPIAFFNINSMISTTLFFGLLFDRIYFNL
ncbi:MAG: UbiA-like polyprenyltransferase [Leptonema sp. (in: bacteria)]